MARSGLMRFNYVRDCAPDAIDRLRSFKVAPTLHAPLVALGTTIAVVVAAWGIEACRLSEASGVERAAALRLAQSRASLAQTRLARTEVERMLAQDRRLRDIRTSGALVVERLAGIAHHVPRRAWLTSITGQRGSVDINGRAEGLGVLSDAIAGLMASKGVEGATLLHAGEDDAGRNSHILSFEVSVKDSER